MLKPSIVVARSIPCFSAQDSMPVKEEIKHGHSVNICGQKNGVFDANVAHTKVHAHGAAYEPACLQASQFF